MGGYHYLASHSWLDAGTERNLAIIRLLDLAYKHTNGVMEGIITTFWTRYCVLCRV
jgi:hypothetical protein